MLEFNPEIHRLSPLCKRGHEYANGKSLYYKSCRKCVACQREKEQASRRANWLAKKTCDIRHPNTPGIYALTFSDKSAYIGSSQDLAWRWSKHKSDLKKNSHHNPKVQLKFNEVGIENIRFMILELCKVEELKDLEQIYLDCATGLLNVSSSAFARTAPSPETSERNRRLKKGNKYWAGRRHKKETIAKIAQVKSRSRAFVSPTGEVHHVLVLKDFCKKYNLGKTRVYSLDKEEIKSYRGWTKYLGDVGK